MIATLRAELGKLLTTRLWWVLALIMIGYVGFTAGLLAGLFGALGDQLGGQAGAPQLPPEAIAPVVYSTVTAVGYVFPLILGTLAITSEVRYQTLTPTFLAQPKRGRVLAAKLMVLAAAGAVFGVIGLVAAMGLGAPILTATGTDAALDASDTWALAGRIVLAMALWAVVGVGVGSLIPNQIAAIVVVLAFTQFVEPILRFGTSIWEWTASVGRFLPGAASDALVGSSVFTAFGIGGGSVEMLEWWQGGLVLLALAVVVAIAGYLTSWRRDIT
ncbi:MAG: ABC transporter permease [Salinibacterium sp.]|nr:ABC transporter permease [Salinibacterium sp.]